MYPWAASGRWQAAYQGCRSSVRRQRAARCRRHLDGRRGPGARHGRNFKPSQIYRPRVIVAWLAKLDTVQPIDLPRLEIRIQKSTLQPNPVCLGVSSRNVAEPVTFWYSADFSPPRFVRSEPHVGSADYFHRPRVRKQSRFSIGYRRATGSSFLFDVVDDLVAFVNGYLPGPVLTQALQRELSDEGLIIIYYFYSAKTNWRSDQSWIRGRFVAGNFEPTCGHPSTAASDGINHGSFRQMAPLVAQSPMHKYAWNNRDCVVCLVFSEIQLNYEFNRCVAFFIWNIRWRHLASAGIVVCFALISNAVWFRASNDVISGFQI